MADWSAGPRLCGPAGLPDRLRQAGWEVSDVGDLARRVFTADKAKAFVAPGNTQMRVYDVLLSSHGTR